MERSNVDFSTIKTKAIHGAISITFSRILLLAINFSVINFLLLRVLPPSAIGTLNLATAVLGFFSFFSDIGLGASIIQKREVSEHDLSTMFVVQETLVFILSTILFLAAPFIAAFYRFDIGGDWLVRSLAVSFFVVSFKSIPSVLLERTLEFRKLVIVEIVETLVKNAFLIGLVLLQFGLFSFAIGQVVSAVIGTLLLYNLSPWKIKVGYSKDALRELLRFGVPYQTNQVLAMLKDQLKPLVVGRMITPAQMGIVTVAQSWAFIPLQVMSIVIRVTFPAYARLQDDREMLGRAVERSLYVMGLVLYPALFGILALIPNLVEVVGRDKWGPTIPLVYLFSFATFWASISTTYTNVFNAVGQIRITFKLMVMWVVLEWLLTPMLVLSMGYVGVGMASAIISFSSIVTIIYMRNIAPIRLLNAIGKPLGAAIIMGIVLFPIARMLTTSKLSIIPLAIIGASIYGLIMLLADRERLLREVKEIVGAIR